MSYILSSPIRPNTGESPMTVTIARIRDGTGAGCDGGVEGRGGDESGSTTTAELWPEAREYIWMDEVRSGTSTATIALREGVARRSVQLGVKRALDRELASRKRDSH